MKINYTKLLTNPSLAFLKCFDYRKYNSYKGEISSSVPNIIQRNFQADRPDQKWLTDITEFVIPAGKIYLSPIIDCFDGMLVSWTFSTTPCAALVNNILEKAIAKLSENEPPLVHTDRGCHLQMARLD